MCGYGDAGLPGRRRAVWVVARHGVRRRCVLSTFTTRRPDHRGARRRARTVPARRLRRPLPRRDPAAVRPASGAPDRQRRARRELPEGRHVARAAVELGRRRRRRRDERPVGVRRRPAIVRPVAEPLRVDAPRPATPTLCQVYGGSAYRASPAPRRAGPARGVRGGQPDVRVRHHEPGDRRHGRGDPRVAGGRRRVDRVLGEPRPVLRRRVVPGRRRLGEQRPRQPELPLDPHRRRRRTLESRYGLGNLVDAYSERDPVVGRQRRVGQPRRAAVGSDRTVVVSDLDFRNAYGFPSHGFTVAGANH